VVATQGDRLALRAGQVVADLEAGAGPTRDSLQRVVASGDVEATLRNRTETVRLRGREMTFTGGEHELIEVAGDPAWETAGYTGTARRFVIHPEVPTFQALDQVSVRWLPPHGSATNQTPILLSADRLVAELGEARFTGTVRARHELWELRSAELDLRLATNSALREIVARRDVELDYRLPLLRLTNAPSRSDPAFMGVLRSDAPGARLWRIRAAEVTATPTANGRDFDRLDATGGVRVDNPAATASGARLAYRATDGLVRLTDQARLKTIDGLEIIGEPGTVIGFHPAAGRFVVEGPVRRMTLPSLALRGSGAASTNLPSLR
jgi:lipopolysaccharide export system protein LptA